MSASKLLPLPDEHGHKPITSGTSPAPVRLLYPPGPASSGTSGSLLYNLRNNQNDIGHGGGPDATTPYRSTTQVVDRFAQIVPDVPDVPDHAGRVPPAAGHCPTCDPQELPAANPDSAGAESPAASLVVQGTVCVRALHQKAELGQKLANPDLRGLLATPAPLDTVLEFAPDAACSILDGDVHHWPQPPEPAELVAHLAALTPEPDAWWRTHGGGFKALFVGPAHANKALAAALGVPACFKVELLKHTRHPASASSQHPGKSCGAVHFGSSDPQAPFAFTAVGPLPPEERDRILTERDLALGARYGHDRCPIAPDASDAPNCVVVLAEGLYCHRCAGHGVAFPGIRKAGFVPLRVLAGGTGGASTTALDELAAYLVHWPHAKLVLEHRHPNLGPALLKEAYRKALEARWEKDGIKDCRIPAVFNPDQEFVRGEGLWLDARTYQPTVVDNDAVADLPYAMTPTGAINRSRRSQVKNRAPRGYVPVRPYRGICLARPEGVIPVPVPPAPRHPIQLLDSPLPLEKALEGLAVAFPRIDTTYLQACLAAGICAEVRGGMPPMLAATGPSGSGKSEVVRLAASFLGDQAMKLQLMEDPESLMRAIGVVAGAGHRFILFDELGKVPHLAGKFGQLLQLGCEVTWRPLHQNQRVTTPCRSAFFFPCVNFPDFLTASPEFNRRVCHWRLARRAGPWMQTAGGDTAAWRDRDPDHARIANSILTHVWRMCHDHDFLFQ